ncbi:MAG: hydrogenase maturation protease [Anaerolineales bacterium]|nr:hydrogenase maturation protease [Anaerolineales bacterium]
MRTEDLQKRALVIGYGNTIRGDDGFGLYVASLLSSRLNADQVTILTPRQLTPDLAEQVSQHELTILIDAQQGDRPGRVHHHVIEVPEGASPAYQHHITPEVLSGITTVLYGIQPQIHLFSVESASFEIGEGLSPAVSTAVEEVISAIIKLLKETTGSGMVG